MTKVNDSVECPFCGYEHTDLWEYGWDDWGDGEITVTCLNEDCKKEFQLLRHVYISYSTEPDPEFEVYLDRHPKIKEELQAQRDRVKEMLAKDRNQLVQNES